MTNCPCCSHPMLRHIRNHQTHWFCRSCWQEMPLLEERRINSGSSKLVGAMARRPLRVFNSL